MKESEQKRRQKNSPRNGMGAAIRKARHTAQEPIDSHQSERRHAYGYSPLLWRQMVGIPVHSHVTPRRLLIYASVTIFENATKNFLRKESTVGSPSEK